MKILKIILFVLVAVIAIALITVMASSSKGHVERSIVINAPQEIIFDEVNNIRRSNNWSPWAELDSNTVYLYDGPDAGVGAKMSWSSEREDVGHGTQWIMESTAHSRVRSGMQFGGFEGTYTSDWILEPAGDGATKVTWTYDSDVSELGFLNKTMGKAFNLMADGMLGPFYEKGLANLKGYVENLPRYSITIEETETESVSYIGMRTVIASQNMDAVSEEMGRIYGILMTQLQRNKMEPVGYPFCITHSYDDESMDVELALPVSTKNMAVTKNIIVGELSGGYAVKGVHRGAYDAMEKSYEDLNRYIATKKMNISGPPWEVYITDPETEPDTTKWITEIYFPISK